MKPKQGRMFQYQDLPLFSGSAVAVQIACGDGQIPTQQQTTFARCRLCMDTGRVEVRHDFVEYCWCEAGDRAIEEDLESWQQEP